MHQQYKTFLDWFLSVSFYSCDQPDAPAPPEYADEEPTVILRQISISSDEFYEQLYEDRNVVRQLKDFLAKRKNLICLVGARGSGKSTIVQKLVKDLRAEGAKNKGTKSLIVLLDLKIETDTNTIVLKNPTTIENTLRARLAAEYRDKLFQSTRERINPRLNLWAFLLDSTRNNLKPLSIFSVFQHLQDKATFLLRKYDIAHPDEKISVEDWLNLRGGDSEVLDLVQEVDGLIDFHHLAYAAYSVAGIEQQIIWFDNMDRLDEREQTDVMIAVRRLLSPVNNRVKMGVSIREENVFRDHELWDDGASPFETRVMLEMPRKETYAYFPAADVPVATDAILRNIIQRRLRFTKEYHAKSVAALTKQITDAESHGQRDEVEIQELRAQLEEFGPVISEHRFAVIQALSDKLLQAMSTERAIYLGNNSIRDFMFIFRDCLADLFKGSESTDSNSDDVPALKYEGWYISTLFLRRARHAQRRYKMGVYDVLASTDDWFKQGRTGVGCLLPHIIITTIWNLILRGKNNSLYRRTPRVGDVVSRLQVLGYDRETVINAMHTFYSHYYGRQNLLEFRDRSIIASAERITDDTPVYLTYRGKCLVGRTSGSFGYLFDCLTRLEKGSESDDMLVDHPTIRSTEDVATALLPHLCDVAQMNYHTFKQMRVKGAFGEASWPYSYYRDFGVPYVEVYSRLKNKPNPMLQLEIILLSLQGYVRSEAAERLGRLLTSFKDAVEALREVDCVDTEPDFRRILDLEPRLDIGHKAMGAKTIDETLK